MVIITNFQSPKEIEDLKDRLYYRDGYTSLEILLTDATLSGKTEWTVDRDCQVGDTVLFMCAKTAKDHIAHVCAEAKRFNDDVLIKFAEEEREIYNKLSARMIPDISTSDKLMREKELSEYNEKELENLVKNKSRKGTR